MEKSVAYREAITVLSDAISHARIDGSDGVYKIVQLDSQKTANNIARLFSDAGFVVDLYNRGKPGYYGFFVCWDSWDD